MAKVGLMMILLGLILIVIGSIVTLLYQKEIKLEYGGLIMIGPLVIPFGSSKNIMITSAIIGLILILILALIISCKKTNVIF